jgi:hypothetical protein
LTTREFFENAKQHLNPGGVLAVNSGRTETDYRLVDALSGTLTSVFPDVYIVDARGRFNNSVIFATSAGTTLQDFQERLNAETDPKLQPIIADALANGNIRQAKPNGIVFTDDLAPVERLIDDIIVSYIRGSR